MRDSIITEENSLEFEIKDIQKLNSNKNVEFSTLDITVEEGINGNGINIYKNEKLSDMAEQSNEKISNLKIMEIELVSIKKFMSNMLWTTILYLCFDVILMVNSIINSNKNILLFYIFIVSYIIFIFEIFYQQQKKEEKVRKEKGGNLFMLLFLISIVTDMIFIFCFFKIKVSIFLLFQVKSIISLILIVFLCLIDKKDISEFSLIKYCVVIVIEALVTIQNSLNSDFHTKEADFIYNWPLFFLLIINFLDFLCSLFNMIKCRMESNYNLSKDPLYSFYTIRTYISLLFLICKFDLTVYFYLNFIFENNVIKQILYVSQIFIVFLSLISVVNYFLTKKLITSTIEKNRNIIKELLKQNSFKIKADVPKFLKKDNSATYFKKLERKEYDRIISTNEFNIETTDRIRLLSNSNELVTENSKSPKMANTSTIDYSNKDTEENYQYLNSSPFSKINLDEMKFEKIDEIANSFVKNECLICFDAKSEIIIMPCGHSDICLNCAKEVWKTTKSCYICQNPIQYILFVEPFEDNVYKVSYSLCLKHQ